MRVHLALLLAIIMCAAGDMSAWANPAPTCDDLSGIDFGECALPLGVGVIDGRCRFISGCESPVPLFDTLEECLHECEAVPSRDGTWGMIKALYRL